MRRLYSIFSSVIIVAIPGLWACLWLAATPLSAADTPAPAPDNLLSLPGFPVYPPADRLPDLTTIGYCDVDGFLQATGQGQAAAAAAGLSPLAQAQAAMVVAYYFTTPRWSVTATDGGATGANGDPVNLTFSFPGDGINVPAFSGIASEVASPNILNATLDSQFQAREIWREQFRRIFRRWQLVAGLRYTEDGDDGASFGAAPGLLGTRGDIRIAGHHIDGASGANVLAYSGFPNQADMVLDTDNTWSNALNGFRYLRNVLGHEQGHALGLDHPENRADTQWLMEPVISTAFDGPQEDDIRGVQRLYGDEWENNDTSAAATDLGTLGPSEGGALLLTLSTDRLADVDWYRFDLSSSDQVTITVMPVGTTYTVQQQGQPVQGTVNAKAVSDLKFTLYQADAVTVIADINAAAAGQNEAATVTLNAAVSYFVKVAAAGGADDVQRYQLSVLPATNLLVAPRAVAPYDRDTVTGRVFATARESYDPDSVAAANQGIVKAEWDTDNNGSFDQLGADLACVVPLPGPQLMRLRVTDAAGLTAVRTFTVNVLAATETRRLTLTAPNAGGLLTGASQLITWTSAGLTAGNTVRIDLSTDCGFTWNVITAGTPNTGSFTWPAVSGATSNNVLIRVALANDPVIADVNDSLLAISPTPTITLVQPIGGESYNLGYPVNLQWTAVGVTAPIQIELSRDGGVTFPTVIAAAAPNTGSYTWTATAPTGTQNRIRLSDSTNALVTATGGNFTLAATPTLTITAPLGGETLIQGTANAITWTATGAIAGVKVEFSGDSGVSFITLAAAVPNTGAYTWTVAQPGTTRGRIRLSDAAAPTVVQSVSPADFTIPPPTLTLITPNGGQTFTQGDTRTVTWTTTGTVAQVNLELSLDNGGTWTSLAANLANTGSFPWFVAQATSAQALIRVRDSSQPTLVEDSSDAVFIILSGVGLGSLAVVSPNGGELLPAASPATLTYTSTGFVPNLTIELSTDNGTTWQTLAAATPNTGSYAWTTPGFFYPSMKMRITDAAAPAVTDTSDGAFQIGVKPRSKKKACALGADARNNLPDFLVLTVALAALALLAAGCARRRSRPEGC